MERKVLNVLNIDKYATIQKRKVRSRKVPWIKNKIKNLIHTDKLKLKRKAVKSKVEKGKKSIVKEKLLFPGNFRSKIQSKESSEINKQLNRLTK